MSKDYRVLVLAMSTLSDPLLESFGKTAFENRYAFKGTGSDGKDVPSTVYHGLGQLEPVPQYILHSLLLIKPSFTAFLSESLLRHI